MIARGLEDSDYDTAESVYRLMFEPQRKKVYPSFPMTQVMDLPGTLAEIDAFRSVMSRHFITFDPGDLDEKRLLSEVAAASRRGEKTITVESNNRRLVLSLDDVNAVAADIDGQIYARDFKLIDQSDMIVSYMPEMPDGRPVLSSGVERELQHAYESTREVYVVWKSGSEPSPFVTNTATAVFDSVAQAMTHFQRKGYVQEYQLRLDSERRPRQRGRQG